MCRQAGLPVEIVSAGGTGTYYATAYEPSITEIQAGGGIFGDVTSRGWQDETEQSLFVRSTVTSRPAADRVILDAGFKALPMWKGVPEPVGLDGVVGYATSAEHAVLTLAAPNETLQVGEALDVRVGYGDMAVVLYDRLYGVRDGAVEVVWDILGRGKLR
jgi:D-serine deaminase-like pyridoxal phosphate-dependent protein